MNYCEMHTMHEILAHLERLIAYESVTPHDVGCQDYMINQLKQLGFLIERFDNPPVSNFFAHIGGEGPLLMFAGHSDVVPIGDESKWHSSPFKLHAENGVLFGRGVADMKGSLAAMLVATKQLIDNHQFKGRLGFLITSGEEGNDFLLGTPYVMQQLNTRNICPQYCIVGEPSSVTHVGDMIKVGRRGSLTATLVVHGKQGHVAYPHLADNPVHRIAPFLNELSTTIWDNGNDYFPPTSLQITHIQAGGQANNIIPGELLLQFNFRYSTQQTAKQLIEHVESQIRAHELNANVQWQHNGEPYLTQQGVLRDVVVDVISTMTTLNPELSTSGGTSDGRFIAPFGVEVIELGLVNATIHQVNEHVALNDLELLANMYYEICRKIIC